MAKATTGKTKTKAQGTGAPRAAKASAEPKPKAKTPAKRVLPAKVKAKVAPKAGKEKPTPKAPARNAKPVAKAKPLASAIKTVAKVVKKVARAVAKVAAPSAAGGARLAAGSTAPSFQLKDQTGNVVSSASLKGKPYVLYFYPKDDTPGCTREACGFRDAQASFGKHGARVIGVSPDSEASHAKFAGKYGLPFTLLSDPEKVLAKAYGAWGLKKNYGREFMGIIRSTFVVDAAGKVKRAYYGVKVDGHVDSVLGDVTS